MTLTRWRVVPTMVALGALLALLVPTTRAEAAPAAAACQNRNINDKVDKFLACIDGADAYQHLEALQAIADANGGTRASGTPGYDESVEYIVDLLDDAGYSIEIQEFDFTLFTEVSSSLTADGVAVPTQTMEYSDSGAIQDGNVIPIDLDLGLGNTSTSGCEASDFDGLDFSGTTDIALVQRGACAFGLKAVNADAAGAEAVIIFNQGDTEDPGRQEIIGGTLGEDVVGVIDVPVLDVSYSDGVALLDAEAVSLMAETLNVTNSTSNVIADLAGNNPGNVVMAGAHLDSVPAGPGINDNGSGSAALLAIALEMAGNEKFTPENTVRFAWWGAEESGLIGSDEYVFNPDFGLTQEEYEALALYLNFDMVASPNYIYGVYDADESTYEATAPVPAGSAALEDLFEAYYTSTDTPYDDTEFSGRSDYQAFINVGIPSSGLFTGAEVIKTEEQEAIWGGTAGDQYDPCYHLACDTLANVSMEALDTNVAAIAYALFSVALNTEDVNGVAGREVRGDYEGELDGPQFTQVEGAAGGLDHGHDHLEDLVAG